MIAGSSAVRAPGAKRNGLRQRLWGGKLANAARGQRRVRLPGGLVDDPTSRVVRAPAQEVAAAVRLVCDLCAQHGAARAAVTHVATPHRRVPTRLWGGGHDGALVGGRLTRGRVRSLRHHPVDAGAEVDGRPVTRTQVLPGEAPRLNGRTRQMTRDEWPIVGRDAHPGYLPWEPCQHHPHPRDDHRTWPPEERRGAVRAGAARWPGLVRGGRCGRRLAVRSLQDGRTPLDACHPAPTQHAAQTWQTRRGATSDAAVTPRVLEAIHPAPLEGSLAALAQLDARARPLERQGQRRRARARYETDRARRRDVAVEPANRLVARARERAWPAKLAHLEHLERKYAAWSTPAIRPVSPAERQHMLALAQDVPAVWRAPPPTNAERTQRLRCLVNEVTVTRGETIITLALRWQPGALTTFDIPRLRRSWDVRQTDPRAVARMRELAPQPTDQQMAACLTADGGHADLGGPFTPSQVGWLRWASGVATGCPDRPKACPSGQRGDGRSSAQQAAEVLHVPVATISAWCRPGRLDGTRATPMRARWITLTPESIAELKRPTRRRHRRRPTAA